MTAWLRRALLAALLLAVAGSIDGAFAQTGPFVYVPNAGGDNTVSVIDTATNTVVGAPIAVGNNPLSVTVRGDGAFAYVTNQGDQTVRVIDTGTNTVVATIAVGNTPSVAALSADGKFAYVTNRSDNTVSVIDTATNTVVGSPIAVGAAPVGAAVTSNGQFVYVVNSAANNVSVIDAASSTIVGTIAVGSTPQTVAITPNGAFAYVTNTTSNTVSVINTATNTVTATIAVGTNPTFVAITPDGTRAYVTNLPDNTVSVINTATNTVTATVATGGNFATGVAITADGAFAYVTNFNSNTVVVIDTATNTVVSGAIPVGNNPGFAGTCGNGNALLATGATFIARAPSALLCTGTAGPIFTGGTLQIAQNGFTSPFAMTLQAAGGIVDTNSNTATLSGVLSGPGGLTKIGAGTLILTGANTYAGPTSVNGGTLAINGSIVSAVTVNNGGTLGGTGIVGPTTIGGGGTLAPGNSIGAITVNGPLIFAAGSIYTVEANAAGQADLTRVNGTATINGGTVNVLAANGTYLYQTTYTILTASGGVAGVFSGVNSNLAFLTPVLSYDADDVFLTLFRNDVAFTSVAQTDNQRSVAAGLQLASLGHPTGNGAAILNAIVNQSAAGARAAYDALSGEGATGAQQTAFGATSQFMSTVTNQTAFWREGTGQDPIGITLGGSQAWDDPSFLRGGERPRRQSSSPVAAGPRTWRLWTTGFGGAAALDGDAQTGSADLSARTAGVAAGLDYQVDPALLVGIAVGGTTSSFSVDSRLSSGTVDGGHVGLYGMARWGALYLTGTLGYDRFDEATQRYIVGVGPTELAKGKFASNGMSGRVETGWKFPLGSINLTPFAAMQAAHLWSEGFTESSTTLAGAPGILGLAYDDRSVTSLPGSLGLQIDTRIPLPSGMTLTQSARVAWVHEFQPDRSINPFLLSLPAAAFHIDGARAASDAVKLNAALKLDVSPGMGLYTSFDAELSGHSQSYAGTGGFKITW